MNVRASSKPWIARLAIVATVFVTWGALSSCASNVDKDLEQAAFYLDESDFTNAQALAEAVLAQDPTNLEAKFILASALLGQAVFSGNAACPDDTGILGLTACLMESPSSGDGLGLRTFVRMAPETAEKSALVSRAFTIYDELVSGTQGVELVDATLQRFFTRLLEIGGVLQSVGAASDNLVCNNASVSNMKDNVPDDYDSSQLTDASTETFLSNLDAAPDDASAVGLEDDLVILTRLRSIRARFDEIKNVTGGTDRDILILLLDETFASADDQVCDEAL